MRLWLLFSVLLLIGFQDCTGVKNCLKKVIDKLQHEEVCVCNSSFCDEVTPLGDLRRNQLAVYVSSIAGKRFNRTDVFFQSSTAKPDFEITLNTYKTYQKIIGFGAAFTDSSGVNLLNLTEDLQKTLIAQFYSDSGIELNMGRVPMGACDFSVRIYSYCDTAGDFDMNTFSLQPEDYQLKIPFIKMAQNFTNNQLKLYSGIWSAPAWMKKTEKMISGGSLKGSINGDYYKAYPKYYTRFFEEYKKNGIEFWGMAIQNEPSLGIIDNYWWPELYLSPPAEREFIKKWLGPAIRSNPVTKNLKIMVNDDQRFELPKRPDEILNDTAAAAYVDGIAVHWYEDFLLSADVLTTVHNRHPDKFILATEACNGYSALEPGPKLGNWDNGMSYAIDIIEDLQNWVSGWTDKL